MKGGKLSADELDHFIRHSYSSGKDFKHWKLDHELSDSQVQVYYNPHGEAVVVHRGSQDVQDWTENALYALGIKSGQPRLEHSKEVQKKAEAKYGSTHVSTVGHSKGAHHAEEVGQSSKEVITLNKPVTPSQILKKIPEKQTDIRTAFDPVSILRPLQFGKKSNTIKSKTLNPIVEHGPSVLKRLNPRRLFGAGATASIPRMTYESAMDSMRRLLQEPHTWSQNQTSHFFLLLNWLRNYILNHGTVEELEQFIQFLEDDVLDSHHIEGNHYLIEDLRTLLDVILYPILTEEVEPELDEETKTGSGRGQELCLMCY